MLRAYPGSVLNMYGGSLVWGIELEYYTVNSSTLNYNCFSLFLQLLKMKSKGSNQRVGSGCYQQVNNWNQLQSMIEI